MNADNWRKQDSDKEGLKFEQREIYKKVRQFGRDWNNSQTEKRLFIEDVSLGKSAQELLDE